MTSTDKLQWGILSTGAIAKAFARGVAGSKSGRVVAVGSRDKAKAEAFGKEFSIPTRHGSYEALLADDQVQAVYIATPHPMHVEWVIKAAEAGKHILCEKPIGLNHAEAMAMVQAAREHDVFLMEAFMYRCHPQTAKLVELIRSGAIGQVRMIQASFSFRAGDNPESRLLKHELAGGGILDVGCYPVSASRLIAGVALGKGFADPVDVQGMGYLGKTGVDEYAAATLRFPGDIIAQVATGVRLTQDNVLRVYGTEGFITVPNPWIPARDGGTVKIMLHPAGKAPEEIEVESDVPLYGIEADTVAANLAARQAASPAMSWDDTLGNMATLDRWRKAMGLTYRMETAEMFTRPLHGRALRRRDDHRMQYGRIPGINKDMSRFVMGCDNQPTFAHAAVLFDDWFERGGNAFDTAHLYGGGLQEKLVGQWCKTRGVRDRVVIIGKGAHSPHCFPQMIGPQLDQTLERLGMDHLDLYLLHRDNPQVPVGEFIDALNEQIAAGRIKAIGGSNWTIQRLAEANKYAAKKGKTPFAVLSNNFSLARMVNPVWDGCIAASDPESRKWLTKAQVTVLAWSSQARGFFTDRSAPDKTSDRELVEPWYSDDNFARKARAVELAKQFGVEPVSIAAAYVLHQPFPTFAVIGPRFLSETASSLAALDIELTGDQVRWLNLED